MTTTTTRTMTAEAWRRKLIERIAGIIASAGYWDDAEAISRILVDHHFPPLPTVARVQVEARLSGGPSWLRPASHNSYPAFAGDGQRCACPTTPSKQTEIARRFVHGSEHATLIEAKFRCDLEGCVNGSQ